MRRILLIAWLAALAITTSFATSTIAKPRSRAGPLNAVKTCGVVLDPFYNPPVFLSNISGTDMVVGVADFACSDGNRSGCGLHTRFTINDVLISDQVVPGTCNASLRASDWVDMSGFPVGDWLCRYQVWDSGGVKLWPDQFLLWSVR